MVKQGTNYSPPDSSWHLPPTAKQCRALVRLGVKDEHLPTTRWEARRLQFELMGKLKKRENKKENKNDER